MLAICPSTFSVLQFISVILKNTFKLLLLLARLESVYSLVLGAHEIWGNVLAVL